jgi:hypothetical protein
MNISVSSFLHLCTRARSALQAEADHADTPSQAKPARPAGPRTGKYEPARTSLVAGCLCCPRVSWFRRAGGGSGVNLGNPEVYWHDGGSRAAREGGARSMASSVVEGAASCPVA